MFLRRKVIKTSQIREILGRFRAFLVDFGRFLSNFGRFCMISVNSWKFYLWNQNFNYCFSFFWEVSHRNDPEIQTLNRESQYLNRGSIYFYKGTTFFGHIFSFLRLFSGAYKGKVLTLTGKVLTLTGESKKVRCIL